ncbi:chemotaxis regulatory protein ChePep [Helicobacter pylori]
MKMILFNQNPMITKLLESVSKKLELSVENFNHYQELSACLKEDPEWILIADDECLEKLDQVDWLELKEIISQNKNSVCMYKKGNEAQPFLEGFEMKIQKPFLPTEILKILQKKLGSNASELEPSQNLDPTQEVLETNWDELENLGDLEALAKEEPNNEEQLLPTLDAQEEKEEIKETPQKEEKPKDDETQESEALKDEEVSKELETQGEIKEETQEEQTKEQEPVKEQEPIKEETQEIKEEKQEKTQDSPSAQELEAMQELVKEIQENSNGQEDKKETQEKTETPQDVETPQAQDKETQEDHYESIEDIPEPVMAKAMGEELPFLNEAVAKTPNNENDTETPKESVIKTPQETPQESVETPQESVETPQESVETPKESDKTSSPLELRLNLQDLLKSLNQESLKNLLENKTLSIKITLEDKKPNA